MTDEPSLPLHPPVSAHEGLVSLVSFQPSSAERRSSTRLPWRERAPLANLRQAVAFGRASKLGAWHWGKRDVSDAQSTGRRNAWRWLKPHEGQPLTGECPLGHGATGARPLVAYDDGGVCAGGAKQLTWHLMSDRNVSELPSWEGGKRGKSGCGGLEGCAVVGIGMRNCQGLAPRSDERRASHALRRHQIESGAAVTWSFSPQCDICQCRMWGRPVRLRDGAC